MSLIELFEQATPEELDSGMNWYTDAHIDALSLAERHDVVWLVWKRIHRVPHSLPLSARKK